MKTLKRQDKVNYIQAMLEFFEIPDNGVLFIHNAFKQFAQDGYSANSTLKTLIDFMLPGTILLPAMSWRFVNQANPIFDELNTPSNTGILSELFRQQYATSRSLHPTHSVAGLGKDAEAILSTHHLSKTPCDQFSPWGKLADRNCYIIMLGVGIDCCTMLHHLEETFAPDLYVKPASQSEQYQCITREQHKVQVDVRKHYFLPRNYWAMQDMLAENNLLKVYRCDNSIALCFNTKDVKSLGSKVLRKTPDFFLAKPGERYRMM